jgi:hypothetical protein
MSDDVIEEVSPVAEYRQTLAQGVHDLLGSGFIRATADALQAEKAALEALGGTFARNGEGCAHTAGRIAEAAARLGEQAAMEPGEGASDRWIAESLLTDLHNLHISVDSSIARSAEASSLSWALDGLGEMHAARLMERIQPGLAAVVESEWMVWAGAVEISTAIEALYALPCPDEVRPHPLPPSELGEMEAHITDAYGKLDSVVAGDDGTDRSRSAANWLEFPDNGLVDLPLRRPDAATARHERDDQDDHDEATTTTLTIDWEEVHRVNRDTCKAASRDESLEFWAWGYLVLIGDDHDEALMNAVRSQPDVAEGELRVVSTSFGPGYMRVAGCPPAQQPQFEWAIGQFSRKEVRFVGS